MIDPREQAAAAADRGDFEGAIEHLKAHLEVHPDDLEAWVQRAFAEEAMQRLPEIEACWLNVLRLDSDHFAARQQLGLCHYAQSRFEAAEALLETCMSQDPSAPWPPYALGLIAERRANMSVALTLLHRALDNDPDNALIATELGAMLAREDRREEARHMLARAIKAPDPTRLNLLTCADAFDRIGDVESACECRDRAERM